MYNRTNTACTTVKRPRRRPEDVDDELQGEPLDLPVQAVLPLPPLGTKLVEVRAAGLVARLQVVVELQALPPKEEKRDKHCRMDCDSISVVF